MVQIYSLVNGHKEGIVLGRAQSWLKETAALSGANSYHWKGRKKIIL